MLYLVVKFRFFSVHSDFVSDERGRPGMRISILALSYRIEQRLEAQGGISCIRTAVTLGVKEQAGREGRGV